jgi:hypothetical protein
LDTKEREFMQGVAWRVRASMPNLKRRVQGTESLIKSDCLCGLTINMHPGQKQQNVTKGQSGIADGRLAKDIKL